MTSINTHHKNRLTKASVAPVVFLVLEIILFQVLAVIEVNIESSVFILCAIVCKSVMTSGFSLEEAVVVQFG